MSNYQEEYARRRLEEMDTKRALENFSVFTETEHKIFCWLFALAMPVGALLAYLFGGGS